MDCNCRGVSVRSGVSKNMKEGEGVLVESFWSETSLEVRWLNHGHYFNIVNPSVCRKIVWLIEAQIVGIQHAETHEMCEWRKMLHAWGEVVRTD